MPSPKQKSYAIIHEIEDEHGGTIIDIETTEEYTLKEKTVKPGLVPRVVVPDHENEALSKVTVEAIPKVHISTLTIEDGHLTGILSARRNLVGVLSSSKHSLSGIIGRNTNMPYYAGPYVVDPLRQEPVVLETAGLAMATNVVLNPIPKNYGLITWDGMVMTVS